MKKRVILSSILTIAMCISIIAGATSALFTSESNNDIAVTSGKVNVSASVSLESVYSPTLIDLNGAISDANNAAVKTDAKNGVFSNGGTAAINSSLIKLTNLTPGDKVVLKVDITNASTVKFLQRFTLGCSTDDAELFDALIVGLADAPDGEYKYYKNFATAWENKEPATGTAADVTTKYISIELPTFVGNEWQTKSCTLNLAVNAVQGNANAVGGAVEDRVWIASTQEELNDCIVNVADGNTILISKDFGDVEIAYDDAKEISFIGCDLAKLTVKAPNGTVHLYNNVDELIGENVALHSLHIYGNVGNVIANQGRVVAEAASVIDTITVNAVNDVVVNLANGASVGTVNCDTIAEGATVNVEYPVNNAPIVTGAAVDEAIVSPYNKLAATITELQTAINEAADGEIVILTDDIAVTDLTGGTSGKLLPIVTVSGKNVIIDLNGKTLSFAPEAYANGVTGMPVFFSIENGANVTVQNGTVNTEAGNNGAYSFNVKGGSTLTIESGYYTGAPTAVQANDGHVVVNGGTFALSETCANSGTSTKYLLNCIDADFNEGTASITVYGGTFVEFNPADVYGEPTQPTSYVLKGWKSVADGDNYVVSRDDSIVLINNAADLLAFNVGVQDGTYKNKNVVLLADIDLGGADWQPIGATGSAVWLGDFDGNGKTVYNFTIDTIGDFENGEDHATGFFGWVEHNDQTIKDLTLKDYSVTGYRKVGGILGYTNNGVTIDNCHVVNATITAITELMPAGNYDNGDKAGGIVGYMYVSDVVTNCTVTNTTITAHRDLGSITGYCLGELTNNSADKITLIQSEVNGYEENVTTVGEINGRATPAKNENNIATNVEIIWRQIPISNRDELINFANEVNKENTFEGKNVMLLSDIDLAGIEWNPIIYFAGTFDGNGHTISNLTITNGSDGYNGLFGFVSKNVEKQAAEVKNFTIENVSIAGNGHWTAAVVGEAVNCNVDNVTVKGDINIEGGAYTGAIVGKGYANVTNCSVLANEGSVVNANSSYLGAIMGWRGEGATYVIDNCTVENVSLTGSSILGGVAGISQEGNKITNCTLNNVHLTYAGYDNTDSTGIGAISGWAGNNCVITGNTFTGKITTQAQLYNNKVVGKGYNGAEQTGLVLSNNKMNVTLEVTAGTVEELKELLESAAVGSSGNMEINLDKDFDVAGNWETFSPKGYNGVNNIVINGNGHKISNLNAPFMIGAFAGNGSITINELTIENANISMTKFNDLGLGAFIAYSDASGSVTLNDCHLINSNVECTDGYAGGLLGYSSSSATITGCTVTGSTISGNKSVGALVGHMGKDLTISDSTVDSCTMNQTLEGRKDDPGAGILVGRVSGGSITLSGTITMKGTNTLTDKDHTDAGEAYEPSSIYCGNYTPDITSATIVTE